MPYWITDDNDIVLKVNNQVITDKQLKQGDLYNTNIEFIAYGFDTDDGNFIQGMYTKIPMHETHEITINIENNDDN